MHRAPIAALCFFLGAGCTQAAPKKLALLIGIDKYRYPASANLNGCVNDVREMENLLIGKFEFAPQNIERVEDEKATRDGILKAFERLIARAEPDDVVVVHYSGHGSRVRDARPGAAEMEIDSIVPHDGRDPDQKVPDINQRELGAILRQLAAKTKNLTFVFDSCHSGQVVRGAKVRRLPPDNRKPPERVVEYHPPAAGGVQTRGMSEAIQGGPQPKYVLLAACRSDQSASEHADSQNQRHGALTYFLVRELAEAKPGATWRDVMDRVKSMVSARYPQNPELEGASADDYVFGEGGSLAQPYVRVDGKGKQDVFLFAGAAHGVTAGSVYNVFAPGTKAFTDASRRIAEVEVTAVADGDSRAKVISGGPVPEGARAMETKHNYPDFKLRLAVETPAESPFTRKLNAVLKTYPVIAPAVDGNDCDLALRAGNGQVILQGVGGMQLGDALPFDESSVGAIEQLILRWAKWFNLRAVANRTAALPIEVELTGGEQKDGELRVPVGGEVSLKVRNKSDQPLYINVVNLSSNGEVSPFETAGAGSAAVAPGETCPPYLFNATLEEGRTLSREFLKVFATVKPMDVGVLKQEAIRGGGQSRGEASPLEALLSNAAGGTTRGLSQKTVARGDWVTEQRSFVVVAAGK